MKIMKTGWIMGWLWLLLLGLPHIAYGEAVIFLNNFDDDVPIYLIWNPESETTNIYYQVLAGPVGGELLPLETYGTTNSVFSRTTSNTELGYFDGGFGVIPGIADGGLADFVVRAWVGQAGSSYEKSTLRGETVRWTQQAGSWDAHAEPPMPPETFTLFIPATISIAQTNYFALNTAVVGGGTIALNPEPVVSGLPKGTTVVATAVPDAGWQFLGWKYDHAGGANPLTITLNSDQTLVAEFTKEYALTLLAADHGTIEISPSKPYYTKNEMITVKAIPAPGYYFLNWTGDILSGEEANGTFSLQKDSVLGANFGSAPAAPKITTQPLSKVVAVGQNVSFSVAAHGVELQYHWFRNDVLIAAANNSTLLLSQVDYSYNGNSIYCEVSNTGGTATSERVSLKVIKNPPVITEQSPGPLTTTNGGSITVHVNAAGEELHYDWYKEGKIIEGATGAVCVLSPLYYTKTNGFVMYCQVTNLAGSARSEDIRVYVVPSNLPYVTFSTDLSGSYIKTGDSFNMTASASDGGFNAFSYQWYFNNTMIASATNATLALKDVNVNNSGNYYCIVKNWVGASYSSAYFISVLPPPPAPSIANQPQSQVLHVGQSSGFYAKANYQEGLTYQWQFNGAAIPDATNDFVLLENVQPEQAGVYRVVVTNQNGSVTSSEATATILLDPLIWEQPRSTYASDGSPVLLWMWTYGKKPFTYQWRLNGVDIPGATNADYSLPIVSTNDSGIYSVVVSNEAGSDTSKNARLIVRPGPQIMQIRLENSAAILSLRSNPGHTYDVEVSQDTIVWKAITTVATSAVLEDVSIPVPADQNMMLYRVVQKD